MNYVTCTDLLRDTTEWARSYREWHTLAGVVGIPRSGMLPAAILSSWANLPMSDLESFLSSGGRFYPTRHHGRTSGDYRRSMCAGAARVLVVDDSTCEGSTLRWAESEIRRHLGLSGIEVELLAVYGVEGNPFPCIKTVEPPRLFEWSWFRSPGIAGAMADMDGLLCRDPPPGIGDGPKYAMWLPSADPLQIPTQNLRAVVSARLEEHRTNTERWLDRWSVRRDDLFLIDATAEEREKNDLYAKHKVHYYAGSEAPIFVESDHRQAAEIHSLTGKPVLCPTFPGRIYR